MSLPSQNDVTQLGFALGPDGQSAAARIIDSANNVNVAVGAVNGTGVSLVGEFTSNILKETVIKLTNVAITITDTGGANGGYGSLKIYDFPLGVLKIGGVRSVLTITAAAGITATGTVKHAVGSVAVSTSDTLSSTLADMLPSTSLTLAASTGTSKGVPSAQNFFDGSSTAIDAILNFGIPDASITTNSSLTVSGTITIHWETIATL